MALNLICSKNDFELPDSPIEFWSYRHVPMPSFMWYWGSNLGLFTCQMSTGPTELHYQPMCILGWPWTLELFILFNIFLSGNGTVRRRVSKFTTGLAIVTTEDTKLVFHYFKRYVPNSLDLSFLWDQGSHMFAIVICMKIETFHNSRVVRDYIKLRVFMI